MDPLWAEQNTAWAQVAPQIVARQREIAERLSGQVAAEAPRDIATARPGRVQPASNALSSADAQARQTGHGQTDAMQHGKTKKTALHDKGTQTDNLAFATSDNTTDAQGLSEAEQKMVADLKARDSEVCRHEQAHAAVGGQYAGSPTYSYQTGPDGMQYAIGGAVSIDVSSIDGDPSATITKMEVVKAAALAPAEPSSADRQVAALADALRAQAVADLAAVRTDERARRVDRTV